MTFADLVFVLEDIDAASSVVFSRCDVTQDVLSVGTAKKDQSKSPASGSDRLNLSGVLNVLDGVVDSPSRILVMTTNSPDRLDAALVRPGRINQCIEMNFMLPEQLCQLIEHLLELQMTKQERENIHSVVEDMFLPPAVIEQKCSEARNLPELLHLLEGLKAERD